MPVSRMHSPKARITVTLNPDLIRQLDELLDPSDVKFRSRVMEEALRAWLRDQASLDFHVRNAA